MLEARFLAGTNGQIRAALVTVDVDGVRVRAEGEEVRVFAHASLRFDAPMRGLPLYVYLPDDARLEFPDASAAHAALRDHGRGALGPVAWLEERWPAVVGALIVGVLLTWGALVYGIPAAARPIAFMLPPAWETALGAYAFETLDEELLEPSTLSEGRQDELRTVFERLRPAGVERLEVHFRSSDGIGANAFALPGGTVVVTDALVELTKDDRELAAVMAHEFGHVAEKHAMRLLIQNTGVALVVAVAFGDVASLTSFGAALPTLLLQSGFSRALEREADSWALDRLEAADIDPAWSARVLGRLEAQRNGLGAIPELLSTHPATAERRAAAIARARDPSLAVIEDTVSAEESEAREASEAKEVGEAPAEDEAPEER